MEFGVPADLKVKIKENDERYKYLDLARELENKKSIEPESDSDTNYN